MKERIKFRKKLFVFMFAIAMIFMLKGMIVCAADNDVYFPIEVTGFNKDLVADTSLNNNLSTNGATGYVDHDPTGGNSDTGAVYFSSTLRADGAFPGGTVITTTTGKKYHLQPTTENNTLQVSNTTANRTHTLTFVDTNKKYDKIGILLNGGGSSGTMSVVVTYADNSQSSAIPVSAYDWYTGPSNKLVYSGLKRAYINGVNPGDGASKMFEHVIDVDDTKGIKSLTFTYVNADGSSSLVTTGNIYAVSGIVPNDNVKKATFNSNGGSEVEAEDIISGNKVTKPEDPTREGFTFDGWYSNSALTEKFSFDTEITENITLYAKWKNNTTNALTPEVTANSTEDTNTTSNPQTGDNIIASVIMLVISLGGLTFSVLYLRKKRFNSSR